MSYTTPIFDCKGATRYRSGRWTGRFTTRTQIVNNIRELKMKQEFKEEISASSMEWMKNFHSVGRFQELQIPVLMKLLES